jgi:spore coat polysaccharide biosynthesis protein SpsF
MDKIICIIQARLSSTRFPKKIIQSLYDDLSSIEFLIQRLNACLFQPQIIVATTTNKADDELVELLEDKVEIYRGNENDVLERITLCSHKYCEWDDTVIEITSDCPFIDIRMLEVMMDKFLQNSFDYYSNCMVRAFPDGFDIQIYKQKMLETVHRIVKNQIHRTHGGWNIVNYSGRVQEILRWVKYGNYSAMQRFFKPDLRIVLDHPDDLLLLKAIAERMKNFNFGISEIFDVIEKEPVLL